MWILHNLRVITSDFFEFWEPVGPSGTAKSHLGQKISCFLISGNHMWHIAKIPKKWQKAKKNENEKFSIFSSNTHHICIEMCENMSIDDILIKFNHIMALERNLWFWILLDFSWLFWHNLGWIFFCELNILLAHNK